jgi:hypothetical protein
MTAGVNADVRISVTGGVTRTTNRGSVRASISEQNLVQFTAGTGTGKADICFDDERTIAASSSENLDLAGALSDVFGSTITAAKVKAIYIEALSTNTNNVVVGGAASNAFVGPFGDATDKLVVEPGCAVCITSKAGWAVTAGTGDILKVANSGAGTAVTYRVAILAASA